MQQYGMNIEILGKVAFVTGGASWFELATSRLLHTEGASVVVVDRDRTAGKPSLQRWASELRSYRRMSLLRVMLRMPWTRQPSSVHSTSL